MFQYVFSFDSLTAAQAARGVLEMCIRDRVDVLREARDDETDEADGRDGDRVGQLRGDVVQVVALRTGGRHDGGVGDGGAVVAADSARARCV